MIVRPSIVVTVDNRVCDRSLGDDADNVLDSWPTNAPEHDGGAGAMAVQPGEYQAQKIAVAANDRAAFDKTFNQQVRIALGLAPQTRTRRNEADDPAFTLNDDGARIVGMFVQANGIFERGSGFGYDEESLHDVLGLLHQIKIDVPLLGDAVAAMAQFDRIDCFPDQHPPDARRDGNPNYDGNNDGVVARHFKDHDHRGHDGGGSCGNQ